MLISISLTGTHDSPSSSLDSTLRQNTSRLGQGLRDELLTAANAANRISSAIGKATNLHALVRPADYVSTPVITPSPSATVSPASSVPPPSQPVVTAQTAVVPIVATPAPASNGYAWGNCTWWAAARRAQIGDPIPNSWGNAATWAARAARDGYAVDHHPTPGAVMQTARSAGGLGHVALVEQVDPDGSWHISEMNVIGLNIVDHAVRPAAAAASYSFIHNK